MTDTAQPTDTSPGSGSDAAGEVETREAVVIRFAGDSGDGMQLTGDRFTAESALFGNDLATQPDYPAEIRAPAGTLAGVSSFQLQFGEHDVLTPGDHPDVLVAMNPAALRAEVEDLEPGATVIVNTDAFDQRNLEKAGYDTSPLEDGSLAKFQLYEVPMTSLTVDATRELGVKPRDAERSKNFFALGLASWMYTRPIEPTITWIDEKFGKRAEVAAANLTALKAGWNFGETAELFSHRVEVRPAKLDPGTYRSITGNVAVAYGLVASAHLAHLPLFLGTYPITPASDILHELARHKNFGVRTFQAEDEIAGIGSAIGAAFAGHLAVTTTSGPGMDLKSEMIGLAVSLELPLVIVNVQRGGPSTGLPTKTEQSDLMQALYGRHGEAPLPVLAARSPGDCFAATVEAARIALKYRTPVILLTDGFLANAAEPWRLPEVDALPDISVPFATAPNHDGEFWPYLRDEVLARPWAVPGTPGLEHRIGGLEKAEGKGDIDYDPANHERMSLVRAARVARIADDVAPLTVDDDGAELLVIGWGSTYGAIRAAVRRVRSRGRKVAHAHLRHMWPMPANTGEVLRAYRRVLVPEMNLGQLCRVLRAEYLVDAQSLPKMKGLPFRASELETAMLELIDG